MNIATTEADIDSLKRVITDVSRDKNIGREVIVDALEQAIIHAARRDYGLESDLEAHYNEESNEIELFQFRTVVAKVEDDLNEISHDKAKAYDDTTEIGDSVGIKIDTSTFGRIAAQQAKQIIVQKVRDAERAQVYEEFKGRINEILSGHVRRIERGDIIIDLGRTEAVIPYREQIPNERYRPKDRVQGYVVDVRRASRGPQVIISRAHVSFMTALFAQQVTEIYDGIVSIESAARDPGRRSKIAVYSRDASVDPVGACVGLKGMRVQAVVSELNGEKIDIIPWDKDPAKLVCNALAPAVVTKVIVDEESRSMEVIVADDQLSLAIGKRGQNVSLAAQLTGWRLDIKSESSLEAQLTEIKSILASVSGIGAMQAEILVHEGIKTPDEIAAMSKQALMRLLNLEEEKAEKLIAAAADVDARQPAPTAEPSQEQQELIDNATYDPTVKTAEEKSDRDERIEMFLRLRGVGEAQAAALADAGYATIGDIIADSPDEVADKTTLPLGIARTLQIAADRYIQEQSADKD
ncbi:MAG: transcription termination factor NusA [Pseudomonadota bacterium]|nr:transcription termination factor NusA [Pseudomonadota bacterium]